MRFDYAVLMVLMAAGGVASLFLNKTVAARAGQTQFETTLEACRVIDLEPSSARLILGRLVSVVALCTTPGFCGSRASSRVHGTKRPVL